jgi:uncharacterized protein YydD (DUF2326 family)
MPLTIHSVSSDNPLFNSVEFSPTFNVFLAERTKEATIKDSRNGLGKSTLIEIIQFCLGARTSRKLKLYLKDWAFILEADINSKRYVITRSLLSPSLVFIDGDTRDWPTRPQVERGIPTLTVKDWNQVLGNLLFGLPLAETRKYKPTFRSLISYFIRRGRDAYSKPFEHFSKQKECDKQIDNAFLLNLSWEDASDWQIIKDKTRVIADLKKASDSGLVSQVLGSRGELQASKFRLEKKIENTKKNLQQYKVHHQYRDLEESANAITNRIHNLINQNISDENLLSFYRESIEKEAEAETIDIVSFYEKVQIELPQTAKQRLEDARQFHSQIVSNRKEFLASEIGRIQRQIENRRKMIEKESSEQSEIMRTLQTHGALEEYNKMQVMHLREVEILNDINTQIENLKKIEEGKLNLRIERDLLRQRARQNYDEREAQREQAISLFNENSQALYNVPGDLVIDVEDSGFKFNVEIERSGSEGVSSMKIFCYDLMLAQLWARKRESPGILIHDSTLFEPVDERQIALAIETACRKSEQHEFQYICMMNSDKLPLEDFSDEFDIYSYVRKTVTDATEEGCLLGMRF